jgi:hypothetical protein
MNGTVMESFALPSAYRTFRVIRSQVASDTATFLYLSHCLSFLAVRSSFRLPGSSCAMAANTRDVDPQASPAERRGLLSDVDAVDTANTDLEEQLKSPALPGPSKTRKRLAGLSVVLSLIIAATLYELWPRPRHDTGSGRDALYSNGTHEFKKTVLMVSIDGLRADYLDRGLTPHLLDISQEGVRAKYVTPVFPVRILFLHLT